MSEVDGIVGPGPAIVLGIEELGPSTRSEAGSDGPYSSSLSKSGSDLA